MPKGAAKAPMETGQKPRGILKEFKESKGAEP
jgi:hypothetical protein